MPLQPIQRQSVSDAVFAQLLDGVLTGDLAPGENLPAERALSEALGVNRQAVREALQRLAQAGMVTIRQGGGTTVLDYRTAGGLDLLPHLLIRSDASVDPVVARSLMELRLTLGSEVARRCAERGGDEHRARATALAEQMAAVSERVDTLAGLDLQFWDTLVDGAGNVAYRLAFNGLRRTYEPIADLLAETLAPELCAHAERRRVAAAIAAGDGEAAAAAANTLLALGEDAINQLLAAVDEGGTV